LEDYVESLRESEPQGDNAVMMPWCRLDKAVHRIGLRRFRLGFRALQPIFMPDFWL
jgi:hypothetical protein